MCGRNMRFMENSKPHQMRMPGSEGPEREETDMSEENMNETKETVKKRKISTKKLVMTGMLSAISTILMVLEFSVPLAPSFIKFDFSDLPVIFGGFMMGPVAGIIIAILKNLLKMVFAGTNTMAVGELANVIGSVAFMLPAVLVYDRKKTKKRAAWGLVAGTASATLINFITNITLTFPLSV